jgi:hypothetical protein
MTLPAWQTSAKGARVRAALWLVQEVGEGGAFRKAQLRDAFPGVEQIDRRMRELREDGWIFATSREDLSLAQDELRLVHIGGAIWDESYRRPARSPVSPSERKAVLSADGFACRFCGIAAGEFFPDDPLRSAKLSVARMGRDSEPAFLTLCDKCVVAAPGASPDESDTIARDAERLSADDRDTLLRWMERDERERTALDRIWARWRALPHQEREQVRSRISGYASTAPPQDSQ